MPRIGLLSDAHGHGDIVSRAVSLLVRQGAQCLIYLGDVGNPEVIDALLIHVPGSDAYVPAHLVFGNVDWDIQSLTDYARQLGIHVDHPVGTMALSQGKLVYFHGDDPQRFQRPLQEQVRYLCHGHTHQTKDVMQGNTRIINPGALCRAATYTVALLDTQTDQLTFSPVDKS